MKKYILILIFAVSTLIACNNEYLVKLPVETLTEATAFGNYSNFQTFAWSLYSVFDNSNILHRFGNNGDAGTYLGDVYAGYLTFKGTSQYNPYAFQTIANASSGNGWDFTYVRSVNIMLANIDKANMTPAEKAHWRSVGYFFRSFYYAELIARFGDVPWVNKVLSDTDPEAYDARMPRKAVADSVLANLQYAELNIKTAGDGKNTINVNCVRALMSRFCLFEGTWRKYYGLGDQAKYLNECVRTSELLMTTFPTVHPDFGAMYTSPDLGVIPGVILYKEFAANVIMNQYGHNERTSSATTEMPKSTLDLYLCKDGKTISGSSFYAGDKTPYTTFRNRDFRLLLTIAPPYQLSKTSTTASWDYPEDPAYREYLDIMGVTKVISNPGEAGKNKVFPLMNWSAAILLSMPNLTTKSSQQYLSCRGGYYVYKNYNVWDLNSNVGNTNTADKPIFKIEEVLLNEAEAKFELDQFSQAIADKTINKLRPRAKIANMVVSDIDANFDPKHDPSINPVLWEIRRERIIELMGEGFGFYDIRRWKVAPWFVNKQQFGMWATKSQVGTGSLLNQNTGLSDPTLTDGYIYLFNDPIKDGKGWLDKYYLYQIPTNAIALNPKITQNPGW
jgi:starch-binding outer membrane protein, SusD/RagB family